MNAVWIPVSLVLLTLSAAPAGVLRQGSAAPAAAGSAADQGGNGALPHDGRIIHQKGISKGVTAPLRVTLSEGRCNTTPHSRPLTSESP